MPTQVHGRPQPRCSEPIRLLMLAVLEDGMRLLLAPIRGGIRRREHRRAQQWFASTDRSYLFGLETICEVLDFDAPTLRARIRCQLNETTDRRVVSLDEVRASMSPPAIGDGPTRRYRLSLS